MLIMEHKKHIMVDNMNLYIEGCNAQCIVTGMSKAVAVTSMSFINTFLEKSLIVMPNTSFTRYNLT